MSPQVRRLRFTQQWAAWGKSAFTLTSPSHLILQKTFQKEEKGLASDVLNLPAR
jgi:hypothetical protein